MARNVVINGVTYNGVGSITAPTTDGEIAVFPDTSADSVTPEVLQKGYTAHNAAGEPIEGTAKPYAAGVVDGKKAEHDAFWDGYQTDGGKIKTYLPYVFAGQGWDGRTFRPKHDIMPKGNAAGIFRQTNVMNLKKILEDCAVILDTSQATNLQYAFGYAKLTNLPKIDISSSTNNSGIFVDSPIEEIDELVVSEKSKFDSTSFRCTKLKHMIVTGTIANANFNVSACTLLDKESNTSIINALSATTTGLTVVLSKAAIDAAFTADEWTQLVATKTNWTIVLAEEEIA